MRQSNMVVTVSCDVCGRITESPRNSVTWKNDSSSTCFRDCETVQVTELQRGARISDNPDLCKQCLRSLLTKALAQLSD